MPIALDIAAVMRDITKIYVCHDADLRLPEDFAWAAVDASKLVPEIIELDDVKQGSVGDCYFLAPLHAIIRGSGPGFLKTIMLVLDQQQAATLNAAINPQAPGLRAGMVVVRFFGHTVKGQAFDTATNITVDRPSYYIVSNTVPRRTGGNQGLQEHGKDWPSILEKAYAFHRIKRGEQRAESWVTEILNRLRERAQSHEMAVSSGFPHVAFMHLTGIPAAPQGIEVLMTENLVTDLLTPINQVVQPPLSAITLPIDTKSAKNFPHDFSSAIIEKQKLVWAALEKLLTLPTNPKLDNDGRSAEMFKELADLSAIFSGRRPNINYINLNNFFCDVEKNRKSNAAFNMTDKAIAEAFKDVSSLLNKGNLIRKEFVHGKFRGLLAGFPSIKLGSVDRRIDHFFAAEVDHLFPGKRGTAQYTEYQLAIFEKIGEYTKNCAVFAATKQEVVTSRFSDIILRRDRSAGLVAGHAYELHGTKRAGDIRYVLLRNPWLETIRQYRIGMSKKYGIPVLIPEGANKSSDSVPDLKSVPTQVIVTGRPLGVGSKITPGHVIVTGQPIQPAQPGRVDLPNGRIVNGESYQTGLVIVEGIAATSNNEVVAGQYIVLGKSHSPGKFIVDGKTFRELEMKERNNIDNKTAGSFAVELNDFLKRYAWIARSSPITRPKL